MPRLCSPGRTLIDVPVNLAVIWSKPRADRPRSGQLTVKALTGGWWDVCSVRYETRILCSSEDTGPCCGIEREIEDTFFSALPVDLTLEELLPVPLSVPTARSAAVSIRGALFSVSQLHYPPHRTRLAPLDLVFAASFPPTSNNLRDRKG